MKFHLLLDLDDTLLNTNIDAFLPAYFKKLAAFMFDVVQPEKFTRALLVSTQIMYESRKPDQTLEQIFNKNFYPALGFDPSMLSEKIEKFYDDVFPSLSSLTSPYPEAIRFVDWAFSKGWDVSIATDPLFPRKAILHRLRWAGLPPEKYPFSLISDFHNFHFAKASVAYYPEFLAQLRWSEEPVLMVGDSLEKDVLPSRDAGIPVFWLQSGEKDIHDDLLQGSYADLKNFLERSDLASLKVDCRSPKSLIAFLQATPAALHTIMLTNKNSIMNKRSDGGDWSLLDVVCHLRDVDSEVNTNRISSILAEMNPFINGQSTDPWADERHYLTQDIDTAFSQFLLTRMGLIETLAKLDLTDWDRKARHSFLGPTTLRELVGIIVDHDRLHINQAHKAVSLNL